VPSVRPRRISGRGIWPWALAARRAGASWAQLSGATGYDREYMERQLRTLLGDLVDLDNEPALLALLRPDDTPLA